MGTKKLVVQLKESTYDALKQAAEVDDRSITAYLNVHLPYMLSTARVYSAVCSSTALGAHPEYTKNVIDSSTALGAHPEYTKTTQPVTPADSQKLADALAAPDDRLAEARRKLDAYNAKNADKIAAMSPAERAIYDRAQAERLVSADDLEDDGKLYDEHGELIEPTADDLNKMLDKW